MLNILPKVCSRQCISRVCKSNIVPCGTPALVLVKSDFTLPIFTCCLCWHKKDVNHLMRIFGSPSDVHCICKVWWSNLSKALLKSIRSIRITIPGESSVDSHL